MPALRVVRVEVDHGQHDVRIVGRALRVRQQLLVLGEVEPQAAVALQRRVLAPDPVDDARSARVTFGVAVPVAQLVLLRVQVLLRAGLARAALAAARTAARRCRSSRPASRRGSGGPGTQAGRRSAGTR